MSVVTGKIIATTHCPREKSHLKISLYRHNNLLLHAFATKNIYHTCSLWFPSNFSTLFPLSIPTLPIKTALFSHTIFFFPCMLTLAFPNVDCTHPLALITMGCEFSHQPSYMCLMVDFGNTQTLNSRFIHQ